MKKKVKVILGIGVALIIVLLILIIILITIKTKKDNIEYNHNSASDGNNYAEYEDSSAEYSVKKFKSHTEFSSYIEKKIDLNRNNVIKIERTQKDSSFLTDVYTYFEVYINVKKEKIYICEFTTGWNQTGTITTSKISKDIINEILSLENEEVPETNQEDSLFGLRYWILEYKDKKINIVNMPEELKDIFYQIYEDS